MSAYLSQHDGDKAQHAQELKKLPILCRLLSLLHNKSLPYVDNLQQARVQCDAWAHHFPALPRNRYIVVTRNAGLYGLARPKSVTWTAVGQSNTDRDIHNLPHLTCTVG
jgi:hypothetical protein